MSTTSSEEQTLRDMLSAYDAGPPPQSLRTELHDRLRVELRHSRQATTNSSRKTAGRVSHPWFVGFMAASVLLTVVGGIFIQQKRSREVADLATSVVAEAAPENSSEIAPLPQDNAIATSDAPLLEEARGHDSVSHADDHFLLKVPMPHEGLESPMQFVLHAAAPDLSPEQRRWRRAWCLLAETDDPNEVFDRWASACEEESEIDGSDDTMAYRIQSALMARPDLQSLIEPLLASEADEAPFVAALDGVQVEILNQMLAQFTGEMATSAKLYLELLLRSREDDGIHQLDVQLQRALASEQLDDSRRTLVRRWLDQLENEKERRGRGPMMM